MDSPRFVKGSYEKGIISKTWERCKSFSGGIGRKGFSIQNPISKSKSCPRELNFRVNDSPEKVIKKNLSRVVPDGCFSIYVGEDKQRFVIKMEYVNHPLFRVLLEEAESEYGYSSEGPLVIPCEVSRFVKMLTEMDCDQDIFDQYRNNGCNFVARSHSSYHMLTPPRLIANFS